MHLCTKQVIVWHVIAWWKLENGQGCARNRKREKRLWWMRGFHEVRWSNLWLLWLFADSAEYTALLILITLETCINQTRIKLQTGIRKRFQKLMFIWFIDCLYEATQKCDALTILFDGKGQCTFPLLSSLLSSCCSTHSLTHSLTQTDSIVAYAPLSKAAVSYKKNLLLVLSSVENLQKVKLKEFC